MSSGVISPLAKAKYVWHVDRRGIAAMKSLCLAEFVLIYTRAKLLFEVVLILVLALCVCVCAGGIQ